MGKQKNTNLFDLNLPNERKFTYLEESPTIVENTSEVADHYKNSRGNSKIYHTFSREISPNTRYFRFDSPQIKGYEPLIGSSKSKYFKRDASKVKDHIKFERVKGRFDKSSQKRFAEDIFLTSQSLYLGDLFDAYETPSLFNFKPKNWDGFPYQDIERALINKETKSFIIDNIIDGFKVGTKKGDLSIITRNPKLQDIYKKVFNIDNPNLKLKSFLEKISEERISFQKTATSSSENRYELQEATITGILDYPENLYIKPSTTGGGYSVFRINKEKGNLIESDSKQFQTYLEKKKQNSECLERLIESYKKKIKWFQENSAPDVIIDKQREVLERTEKEYSLTKNDENRKSDLSLILYHLVYNPIVEEEIPFATFSQNGNNYRPEFRAICQNTGKGFDTEIYSKIGESEVSANISLGASALSVEEALKSLYNESKIPTSNMSKDLEQIIEGSKTIARRQMEYYGEKEREEDPKNPRDLAVDVVPSINPETGELDFYFMEINWQYGFSGLKATDPEAAQRVIDRKRKIRKK